MMQPVVAGAPARLIRMPVAAAQNREELAGKLRAAGIPVRPEGDGLLIFAADSARATQVLTASPEGRAVALALRKYEERPTVWRFRDREKSLAEPLVMGILNVTPDSFSDGGRYLDPERALEHAAALVAEGADILDIGGESTRPGYTPVPAEEESRRILPVIRELFRRTATPISVDTTKASVARAALEAGASIVNDVWGLAADPDMARVVADFGAGLVLMHNRREVLTKGDILDDILVFLAAAVERALGAGISPDRLAVDPGIGFGKTYEQNLIVLRRLDELRTLGLPILVGTSRKSVIGLTLDLPVEERLEGTAATVALAVLRGADILRVHDVRAMGRVIRMTRAVLGG